MKAMIADNSGKNVDAYFHIDRKSVLGTGGFATVCLATTKTTGRKLAVKCILKAKIPDKARLADEIKTMLALDHPNIIKLFQTFEDSKQIYLVMELCAGGELFDVIVAQDKVSESDAAIIMQQMFRAVNYMHEAGVCHRDIKPENFLFTQKGVPIKSNTLKIVDFGIAAVFEARKASFTSRLGTPFYVAPEVLARGARYNEKADLWSCGVILYVLLSGQLPFKGPDLDPAEGDGKMEFDDLGDVLQKCTILGGVAGGGKTTVAHAICRMHTQALGLSCYGAVSACDQYGTLTKAGKTEEMGAYMWDDCDAVSGNNAGMTPNDIKNMETIDRQSGYHARWTPARFQRLRSKVLCMNTDSHGSSASMIAHMPWIEWLIAGNLALLNAATQDQQAQARRAVVYSLNDAYAGPEAPHEVESLDNAMASRMATRAEWRARQIALGGC
ncbi:unnamed protein product [Polarella glacialis]|uniref:non-specific serine/threonine protein kinase n=1 Tax=Polarella glacialis TaxID=89957 RepID=A0A813DH34_POLGL|nr:unnamed protein product [Polarella glacialis]